MAVSGANVEMPIPGFIPEPGSPLRHPRPVLERLGDVGCGDAFLGGEIGDGAGQFEHPVIGAGGETHLAHGRPEQRFTRVVEGGVGAKLLRSHVGVG